MDVNVNNDPAAEQRRRVREELSMGNSLKVDSQGQLHSEGEVTNGGVNVPDGKFAGEDDCTADSVEEKKNWVSIRMPESHRHNTVTEKQRQEYDRQRVRELLSQGSDVKTTSTGAIVPVDKNDRSQEGVLIPKGKFASYYWYERDPELFEGERDAMAKSFPQFKLSQLNDGRLSWEGVFDPGYRRNGEWYLQLIYNHNHPSNSTHGGSIKVYPIMPNLDDIEEKINEYIPHTLNDEYGHVYLCSAGNTDFKIGRKNTSAASVLGWVGKWIFYFESWMAGEITTQEFNGEKIRERI